MAAPAAQRSHPRPCPSVSPLVYPHLCPPLQVDMGWATAATTVATPRTSGPDRPMTAWLAGGGCGDLSARTSAFAWCIRVEPPRAPIVTEKRARSAARLGERGGGGRVPRSSCHGSVWCSMHARDVAIHRVSARSRLGVHGVGGAWPSYAVRSSAKALDDGRWMQHSSLCAATRMSEAVGFDPCDGCFELVAMILLMDAEVDAPVASCRSGRAA